MRRRTFIQLTLAAMLSERLLAAEGNKTLYDAANILAQAVERGQIASAALHVTRPAGMFSRALGKAGTEQAMFLLGSISKPICVTALMTLYDQGKFALDDRLSKFLPKFVGDGREQVTVRHLLTHTSGLADQLPENNTLRKNHASLDEFAEHALGAKLSFTPGSHYQYSSMGILLVTQMAQKISGLPFRNWWIGKCLSR